MYTQEKWIKMLLQPWMDSTVLSSLNMFLPSEDCSGFDNVMLVGYHDQEDNHEPVVLKEIVIMRHARVIHVYNIYNVTFFLVMLP